MTFQTYFANDKDNILCCGQYIDLVQPEYIHYIDFLLCAEWGDVEDCIKILYEDNSEEYYKILARDVSDTTSVNTITLGVTRTIEGEIVNSKAAISYSRISISKGEKIKGIILPESPNLHVISVTKVI